VCTLFVRNSMYFATEQLTVYLGENMIQPSSKNHVIMVMFANKTVSKDKLIDCIS